MCGTCRYVASNFSMSMSKIEIDQVCFLRLTSSRSLESSIHILHMEWSFPALATLSRKELYWCQIVGKSGCWPSVSLLKISTDLSQDNPVRFDSREWGILSIKTTTRSKYHHPWSYPSRVWSFWSLLVLPDALCLLSLLTLLCRSS